MTVIEPHHSNIRFPWKVASVLYGISFGPQFLTAKNLFWDDWYLINPISGKIAKTHYEGSGRAPWSNFFESEILHSSPVFFRIVTFLAFFASAYLLFKTLFKSSLLTRNQIVATTLIFLLVPVNSARIALITNAYSVSYLFFFLGFYLVSLQKSWFVHLLGSASLFICFNSIGFIPFSIIPVLYIYMINRQEGAKLTVQQWMRILLVAATPIIYLICRNFFWPPTSGYATMYTPQKLGLIRGLLFVFVCTVPLAYGLFIAKWQRFETSKYLISIGLFTLSIGAFPYMVGGHLVDISDWLIAFIPNFSDWNSRHQLLLPLGIALMVVGAHKFHSTNPLRWNSSPIFSAIIIFCIVLNITFAQEYFLDGKKQDAIMAELVSNKDLRDSSSILIDDSAVRFNARGRLIRSYEWEAMLEKAFGDSSRKVSYLQYVNCAEFQPDAILHINSPNGRLESTLRRNVTVDISVEKINPCEN